MTTAKGEVRFDALGDEWTFLFDFNAICSAEEAFGKPFVALIMELFPSAVMGHLISEDQAAEAAKQIMFGDLRRLFRIGLEAHHPDVTDSQAGSIIHDFGTTEAMTLLGEATFASMGSTDDEGNGKAGNGAGGRTGTRRKPRPKSSNR